MRRILLAAVCTATLFLLAPSVSRAELVTSALGIPCAPGAGGTQQCTGTMATRVPTWDGVPLDVNLTFPPAAQDGPYPLIIALHGWPFTKETTAADANPSELAPKGYAVLSYTARGMGLSCGLAPSRTGAGCARGWVHIADARYEAHDAQYLAGLLADAGLIQPRRIGATGSSYGGGQSFILAALRDRTMARDGRLVPWRSPNGKPMRIAAAAPRIGWTDLTYALTPNGETIDFHSRNPYRDSRTGVPKASWLDTLYSLGQALAYYAPEGADPEADITGWKKFIRKGDPYDRATARALIREFKRHRSPYYFMRATPAPILAYNAFTDDLFPADEAIRAYNLERALFPRAEMSMLFADGFGHARASLAASAPGWSEARDAFFDHYLLGKNPRYRPLGVETYTQGCNGQPVEGPFRTRTWHGQHPGEVDASFRGTKSFDGKGGSQAIADAVDPNASGGFAGSCRTVDEETDADTASYSLPRVGGSGYTLLGAPTVVTNVRTSGGFPQIQARLWDVTPDGKQTLVTRGAYAADPAASGRRVLFQLHPNGWHFMAGHVVKLELLGRDSPYGQASNTPFTVRVSRLRLELPVHDKPGGIVRRYSAPRLPARALVAKVRPRRDRHRPFRFRTRGRLVLPDGLAREDGCKGRVTIRITRGHRTLSRKRARVRRNCRFSSRARIRRRRGARLRVRIRFGGNKLVEPRRARSRRVRIG
jgi:dienelactone hydrolase